MTLQGMLPSTSSLGVALCLRVVYRRVRQKSQNRPESLDKDRTPCSEGSHTQDGHGQAAGPLGGGKRRGLAQSGRPLPALASWEPPPHTVTLSCTFRSQ